MYKNCFKKSKRKTLQFSFFLFPIQSETTTTTRQSAIAIVTDKMILYPLQTQSCLAMHMLAHTPTQKRHITTVVDSLNIQEEEEEGNGRDYFCAKIKIVFFFFFKLFLLDLNNNMRFSKKIEPLNFSASNDIVYFEKLLG